LVAKGYSQILGIDVFFVSCKHSSIHTLLSIVAMHDYEFEQLGIKMYYYWGVEIRHLYEPT
jgi:hypothetical protein